MSQGSDHKGLRILSLDGGGPGCFSQLVILDEYMSRIAHEKQLTKADLYPADYFDLIGGVGFGAYIAVMLGSLRMTLQNAMKELHTLGTKISAGMPGLNLEPKERLSLLKDGISEMLGRRGVQENISLKDASTTPSACKVAVLALRTHDISSPQWFRSYPSRHSEIEGSLMEILSASMALPTIFPPVSVGPNYAPEDFSGAGFGLNNPTGELLKEAKLEYGDERQIALILSLGSGRPREISLEHVKLEPSTAGELLIKLIISGETIEREVSYQLYDVGAYMRLNVDQGVDEVQFHQWNHLGKIRSHTQKYLQSEMVTRLIDRSIEALLKREGVMTLYQLTPSTKVKRQAKAPPSVSLYFVVRSGWEIMEAKLTGPRQEGLNIFVITGMGGCGKTQMASFFVQKHHYKFKYIFFIDASSRFSIKSDLKAAIQSLPGHHQDTDADALSFLANQSDSLLIFDNADNPGISLMPFFPRSYRGIILITSRLRDMGELATLQHLELGAMSHEEAMQTLAKASRRPFPVPSHDRPHMEDLVEELGGLALALVQAGVYIFKMGSNDSQDSKSSQFQQYLALLKRERGALMRKEGTTSLDEYKRGVFPTLDLSYSLLPAYAREFLRLCSQFHYTGISLAMLLAASETDFAEYYGYSKRSSNYKKVVESLRSMFCPSGEGKEIHIREMINCLSSFSLVHVMGVRDTVILRFHPLVHAWAREMSSFEDAACQYKMAATVLSACKRAISPAHEQYLPQHVTALVEGRHRDTLEVEELLVFSDILMNRGASQTAVDLASQAVKILEGELGSNHQDTANGYMILSNAYYNLGRRDKAAEWNMKALKLRKTNLGEKNPHTIVASGTLANNFRQLGKLKEAETLEIEVLQTLQEILGDQHPDTVKATSNLAATYGHQGRLKEAEELQVKALEVQRKILGEHHPDTLMAAGNLAFTYHKRGKFKEAEELESEVLKIRRDILGEQHPDTLRSLANLAATYAELGKIEEAEELQTQVFNTKQKILGEQHPDTWTAAVDLAITYRTLGKLKAAEKLGTNALKMQRDILGEQHPDTIKSASKLSATYRDMGKLKEAEKLLVLVLKVQKEVLGEQHPDTIMTSVDLAFTYQTMERLIEAEELTTKNVELQQKVLGKQHPATIYSLANLACIYGILGRLEEAGDLIKDIVDISREALGENHLTYVWAVDLQEWIELQLRKKGRKQDAEGARR